jgi:hypothetical protein
MTPMQMQENGSAIVTKDEMATITEALDELANQYEYESENASTADYAIFTARKAEALASLSQTLKDRRGNESEWTR